MKVRHLGGDFLLLEKTEMAEETEAVGRGEDNGLEN